MNYYLYQISKGYTLEQAEEELTSKGLKDLFVVEDATGEVSIGGHGKKKIETKACILIEEKEARVNWDEQWAFFAENFIDGLAHIYFGDKTLKLTPGEGFGDLSHPTTSLIVDLMRPYVANASIVDIGSGSGILTLSALLLGAKKAIGIDIDDAAIAHAQKNAKINGLDAQFAKELPQKLEQDSVFLMNMIFPEQEAFKPNRLLGKMWITSGILKEQRSDYLNQTFAWGWKCISEKEKDGWLGFVFTSK